MKDTKDRVSSITVCALFVCALWGAAPAYAQSCPVDNRFCIIKELELSADAIENQTARDQAYQEIAKTLAFEGEIDAAVLIVDKIAVPAAKASAIRAVGMAAGAADLTSIGYPLIFTKLRETAETIKEPSAYANALIGIAAAQASAGDHEGAWITASELKTAALQQKALAEMAEIQADKEEAPAAMHSISLIGSESLRNKSYAAISKILTDREKLQEALQAAEAITNAYERAQALQYILDMQTPKDLPH